MTIDEGDPTGLLVLRGWVEPGSRLRVRVTGTTSGRLDRPTTVYAATEAEVLDVVAAWLAELTEAAGR